ncbi:lecithin retinol acyltransferase family protein [Nostoc sp. UIC 10607]|uniref:lecithin retinol acyltransferase family protein n=1 Tax=Nostoc sp. UIC 10607 TaxID=3045935 RepID=UPI0039A017BE
MMGLEPGDHIKIPINFKGNPFTHHGIYVGDYYLEDGTPHKVDGVVHFEKQHTLGEVKIKHTDLEGFCKYPERVNEIEVVNYNSYFSKIERMKVVENALKCAQKYESYGNNIFKKIFGLGYNIATFNCEHLATQCRLGYAQSSQGDLLQTILFYGPEIQKALQKMY